jgi:hypothetical protein
MNRSQKGSLKSVVATQHGPLVISNFRKFFDDQAARARYVVG